MRILHVIAQKPGCTGSGIFLNEMLRQAYDCGHENWLVAGADMTDGPVGACSDLVVGQSIVRFNSDELPFPVVGMSDDMPYPSTRYRDMDEVMRQSWSQAFRKALEEARDFNPQRIWVHHLWELVPIVVSLFPEELLTVFAHGTELRQMDEVSKERQGEMRHCAIGLHDIVALNEVQATRITEIYGVHREHIRVVGAGFEGTLFYPEELITPVSSVLPVLSADIAYQTDHVYSDGSALDIRVLYAGKISPAKGVGELIEATGMLMVNGYGDFSIELIGAADPKNEDMYMKMAEPLGNVVRFSGALSHSSVAEKFRHSGVFVLPSYYEGSSLVTLEALAAGMRVVVNDLAEIRAWIPTEALTYGRVTFVEMPGILGSDTPCPEDLPQYVERLSTAIRDQCERYAEDIRFRRREAEAERQEIFEMLEKKWSWSRIFKRILNDKNN